VQHVLSHIINYQHIPIAFLRPSSGQLYKCAKNTMKCQTVQVEPPSVMFY